ncbi:hypothetical protein GV64_17465 [Endozoicomonas elysicola]|uniref:CheR-type methyltransferase domain-containing protein n=1 Tax=Endozoicomonas elysicola TaxID=305900 RepID=A0A081KDQ4_9GAMM|nr:hypothetical protein GV64_17465 [Endozoicomonas elysicola]
MDPESIGQDAVDQSIQRRMDTVGVTNPEQYYLMVTAEPQELSALVDEITVGETWFFREFRAFSVLQEKALRCRTSLNSQSPFRVASMPCSSGEEAYSIAMALMDIGLQSDQFVVDGFDINTEAIQKAHKADYGRVSFRGTMPDFSKPYFDQTAAGFHLKLSVKQCANFHQVNLLELTQDIEVKPYDVIFCRNFLIYLDTASRKKMADVLRVSMKDHGVLIVGHCEAPSMSQFGFSTLDRSKRFCFSKKVNNAQKTDDSRTRKPVFLPLQRKPAKEPSSSLNATQQKASSFTKSLQTTDLQCSKQASSLLQKPEMIEKSLSGQAPEETSAGGILSSDAMLEAIEELVDCGKLSKARESCQQLMQHSPEDTGAQFMMGIISEAEGEWDAASNYFRKVLYLNPEHHEALLHSAMVCERQGEMGKAENFRVRLSRLIS